MDRHRQDDRDVHFHVHVPGLTELVVRVDQMEQRIMAALDELRAQLTAANAKADEIGTTVTEIASDLDDLIAKLAAGAPGSQEVIDATAEATALTTRLTETGTALQAAAGKHTP